MSNHPDDDLFSSSTMTFGEHIEELRSSLFRALVGLLIGFALGLLLATKVVEFIKLPLTDALTKYYGDKAEADLIAKYNGQPPPELMNMVQGDPEFAQGGQIPDLIEVDFFSFLDGLRRDHPGQFEDVRFERYVFVQDDVKLSGVASLAEAILGGKSAGKDSLQRAVWDVLSAEQRKAIESLADTAQPKDDDRLRLVAILNQAIDKPELHQANALGKATFVRSLEVHTRVAAQKLLEEPADQNDPETTRRLNRLLVSSFYSSYLRKPHVYVVSVTVWKPKEVRVQTLNAHEAFMIWIKAAVISGVVMASPWIFWQIWLFVAAGLYPHERKYVWVFLPFSLILFLAGAAMAFFFVFRPVLEFLFSFNRGMNIDPDPRISEWLGFVLFLPIGFGISFQLPLVMLFLHRIGIFTVEAYLSKWRIAVLVIFVLAMFLTPADPVSMLLMAVPLTVLYFGGIALCHWMPRIRGPYAVPDEP